MKRILSLAFVASIFLVACTKKKNAAPIENVTINGKAYTTVKIGNRTWTSQNYDGPGGIVSPWNDEASIGKFYLFSELTNITLPSGWRIPADSDFSNLLGAQGIPIRADPDLGWLSLDSLDSSHLLATSGWYTNGNNLSGFNGLSTGVYNASTNDFSQLKEYTAFWSTTSGPEFGLGPTKWFLVLLVTPPVIINNGPGQTGAFLSASAGYNTSRFNLRFVRDN